MTRFAFAIALTATAIVAAAPLMAQDAPGTAPQLRETGTSWTGGYAGVQLGYGLLDSTGNPDEDAALGGVHLGYNHDFGDVVLGAELDYDLTDIDTSSGGSIDSIARLKLRAGYDFGLVLGYVTAGIAQADTSIDNDTGATYGIGFAYQVSPDFTIGGEYLQHDFDSVGGLGADSDVSTITLRGSIRF